MANATVTGASLSGIYGRLNGVSGYHPISANTFADWSVQAGDVVSVIRGEDSYESPVHTSRMVWKGAPEIELNSTGNKEREAITKVARKKYGRGSSAINTEQSIYREFTSSDGLLYSAIYMSASVLRTEFYASESTIYSYIEQTASGIRQVVANTASGLQSSINQQADRISLVVEGTGNNAHIKPASIVAAINDSSSTVKISADHIILDGNAVAESLSATEISVTGVTATYVTPLVLDLADARIETDTYHGTIDEWIVGAAVESGVLYLFQANGEEITFEKAGSATSLSGNWSGRTYTVTASPQGNTISEPVTIHVDYPQGSPPTPRARMWVATSTGSGSGYNDHGDPTTLYMVPSNLTVSLKSANSTLEGVTYAAVTLSDANLIASNIKSGVKIFGVTGSYSGGTSLSGSWSGRTYTVTASPQGNTISEPVTIHVDIPQAQPTATARAWVATSTGSGSGYINHGDPAYMYLVKNNLTVSLKSANSISSGQVYATTTLSDANLVAGNIKSGVSIFGVSGSYSTDSAKNEVKIKPFTANSVSSLVNYRTFTYTTDAPNPASGTSRVETWYVVHAGLDATTSGNDKIQPGTLKAELRYGTSSGTAYARRNFTINHVELWTKTSPTKVTTLTISSATKFYPWCMVDGEWLRGSEITITPSSGSHSPKIDYVWTSQSIPSGATQLNSLKTQYELAKSDSDNFCIRVSCGGTTKTYYCTP